jgi:protein-disulfide isomerase
MTNYTLQIDIYSAPNCGKCGKAMQLAEQVIKELRRDDIVLCKIDVVKAIDEAVRLGILATPAIVIDGELVFIALPSAQVLQKAIVTRLRQKEI